MPFDRQAAHLDSFNRQRERYGEDVCSLIQIGKTGDGKQGHKLSETPLATNVPCFYEELSAGDLRITGGGEAVTSTHRLTMEATTAVLSLTPTDRIEIAARNGTPALVFEQLIRSRGSFSPLAEFHATLVTQGYRPRT